MDWVYVQRAGTARGKVSKTLGFIPVGKHLDVGQEEKGEILLNKASAISIN